MNKAGIEIKKEILIYRSDSEKSDSVRCVLLENGRPSEMLDGFVSSTYNKSASSLPVIWLEQDIILAKVSRIVKSLDCAFVELAQEHEGMLPLKLAPAGLKAGQSIMVQVRRLTQKGKGCQLTARPQLPGFFAVCRPHENRPLKRSKLAAADIADTKQLFDRELENLEDEWRMICQDASSGGSLPRLLARFQDPIMQALRDWTGKNLRKITAEGMDLFIQVDTILKKHAPMWQYLLQLLPENNSSSLAGIYRTDDLDRQVNGREFWLKNGGKIIFDQTEALLAIDVNSAKAVNKKSPQQLWLQTNLLAAEEIARLIRLRRFQGLAVIDFIRLKAETDREILENHFNLHLARDSARLQSGGFTKLGLFEITRSMKKL